MADKNAYPYPSLNTKSMNLSGSFAPNGTGAVDNTQNNGRGFTVARSGVGTFVITLDAKFVRLRSCGLTVQLATPANTFAQLTGETVATTQTITITTLTAGAAADIAAAAGNRIHFDLDLSNDTVQR